MASRNATRRASGARGGARGRVPAVIHPGQLSYIAGLPHLDGDGATAVRRFAESAFSVDEQTGLLVFLSPPGTPPVTSEDVRRELEDFP